MKISTKIIIILLQVALIPWLVGGYIAYSSTQEQIQHLTFVDLDTAAEIQKNRLQDTLQNKLDLLRFFSTSSELKGALRDFTLRKTAKAKEAMQNFLSEKMVSEAGIRNIFVTDASGIVVASTDLTLLERNVSAEDFFKRGIQRNDDSVIKIESPTVFSQYVVGPLQLENQTLGAIVLISDANDISSVTRDYVGLGKSGETELIRNDGSGNAFFLVPTRYGPTDPVSFLISKERTDAPAVHAINGEEGIFRNVADYRGVPVVAATRYIPSAGWGVVVKIDESEAFGPIRLLRDLFLLIIGIIAILIVFIAISITRSITGPIKELTEFAGSVAAGNLNQSIVIDSRDEIGRLARAFNNMLLKLRNAYETLEQKVAERTAGLAEKTREAEDSREAAFNIAADLKDEEEKLAEEKTKAESLANDLEKFKLALDNTSDLVLITDPEGIVVYANAATEKITGYAPEEAIGKKAGMLWRMPMPLPYYQQFWHTIKDQKTPFIGEIQNKRKNGQLYISTVSISPVLDKAKNIMFFVGLERDITKEKEIDKAKSEFISLASHQMRTPLTAINWYSEMLLGGDAGKMSEKQNEYFRAIYTAGRQMNDIIKSFLHILRLETGTVAMNPVPVNLPNVEKTILKELLLEIEKKDLHIVEQYQEPLPELRIDAELVRVVLQNLISNAAKYTPEKGEMTVALRSVKQGETVAGKTVIQDALLASVHDTGIGIPVADRDKIFTKFFRTDNAKKWDPNGNGLGLYMTNRMVDTIGGAIWFESEEGKGTTFYVLLPLSGKRVIP